MNQNPASIWSSNRLNFVAALVCAQILALSAMHVRAGESDGKQGTPVAASQAVTPQMIGDWGGGAPTSPFLSGFKISENESPKPENRVFATFNYINDVTGLRSGGGGFDSGLNGFHGGTHDFGSSTFIDKPVTDIYRETLGFEKTLFSDNFSLGLRVPIYTIDTSSGVKAQTSTTYTTIDNGFRLVDVPQTTTRYKDIPSNTDTELGDISLIAKYAFYNNPTTGNVISGGLSLTLPTTTACDPCRAVVVQPFAGGIHNCGNFYVQGFTSFAVPTESHDTSYWFLDTGVGYRALPTPIGPLTGVFPTVESHLNVPLNNNGDTSVDLTEGVHLDFLNKYRVTVGVSEPVTGPKPFDVEAVAEFNLHF